MQQWWKEKRPVASANLHSLIISKILGCHLLQVVFVPLSLEALAVNQTLLYLFLSESSSNRLSKIRLAWDMGQSYAEKKITIEAELFESHQFLCRPCSCYPLLYYRVVHPVQGALFCKKNVFCIFGFDILANSNII